MNRSSVEVVSLRPNIDSADRRSCGVPAVCHINFFDLTTSSSLKPIGARHLRYRDLLHGLIRGPQKKPPFLRAGQRGFVPQMALGSEHGCRPSWRSHYEWRKVWQVAGLLIPAACTAARTARCTNTWPPSQAPFGGMPRLDPSCAYKPGHDITSRSRLGRLHCR